jgi:hypothetical protein
VNSVDECSNYLVVDNENIKAFVCEIVATDTNVTENLKVVEVNTSCKSDVSKA